MDITLFELHLPGAEFNAPYAGHTGARRGRSETDKPSDDGPANEPSEAGALVALAALAGIALLAWYLRREPAHDANVDE